MRGQQESILYSKTMTMKLMTTTIMITVMVNAATMMVVVANVLLLLLLMMMLAITAITTNVMTITSLSEDSGYKNHPAHCKYSND